jgi:hypothetical protein
MATKRRPRSAPTEASPLFASPMGEQALHEKILSVIQEGRIPNGTPDNTCAVSGAGAMCGICELPVTRTDETGVEVQFASGGDNPGVGKYTFHLRCYAAWEFERGRANH